MLQRRERHYFKLIWTADSRTVLDFRSSSVQCRHWRQASSTKVYFSLGSSRSDDSFMLKLAARNRLIECRFPFNFGPNGDLLKAVIGRLSSILWRLDCFEIFEGSVFLREIYKTIFSFVPNEVMFAHCIHWRRQKTGFGPELPVKGFILMPVLQTSKLTSLTHHQD